MKRPTSARNLLAWTLLLAALEAGARTRPEATPDAARKAPVSVFEELEGTWAGDFVGWDLEGRELYRMRVRQSYRTVDGETQVVRLEDRGEDGSVVTGRGENRARRKEDGRLELTCVVKKSNGDQVEHLGRLIEGPEGERQIVWHSAGGAGNDQRREMFRERVRDSPDGPVYAIDGVGIYGGTTILMAGRYRKVAEPSRRR